MRMASPQKCSRQVSLNEKCPSNIEEMAVFAFSHPILLGGGHTGCFMENTFGGIEINEVKFWPIVTPNGFHSVRKLSFNKVDESDQMVACVRFVLH